MFRWTITIAFERRFLCANRNHAYIGNTLILRQFIKLAESITRRYIGEFRIPISKQKSHCPLHYVSDPFLKFPDVTTETPFHLLQTIRPPISNTQCRNATYLKGCLKAYTQPGETYPSILSKLPLEITPSTSYKHLQI